MKKIKLEYKVLIIISFLLAVIVAIFVNSHIQYINKKTSEHIFLEKSIEVNGTITDMFVEHGIYVTVNDSLKYFIESSDNYLYKNPSISSVLKKGNLIQKRANSDTIFIYEGKIKYYFIQGEFINKK